MTFPRCSQNTTLLPDGTVLVTGGAVDSVGTDVANAVYPVELWSPATETWTTLASMNAPRLYHSEALLLPDGRVLISGGGRFYDYPDPNDQLNAEFFAPPYLQSSKDHGRLSLLHRRSCPMDKTSPSRHLTPRKSPRFRSFAMEA
jgi:hypothetical protein